LLTASDTLFPYTTLFRSFSEQPFRLYADRIVLLLDPGESGDVLKLGLQNRNPAHHLVNVHDGVDLSARLPLSFRVLAFVVHSTVDRKSTRLNSSHVKISY